MSYALNLIFPISTDFVCFLSVSSKPDKSCRTIRRSLLSWQQIAAEMQAVAVYR